MEINGCIVGFIYSGVCFKIEMANEAFKSLIGHHSNDSNIVKMSVEVDPAYQRQGFATLLMRNFVAKTLSTHKSTINLMCRSQHISMYENMDYRYLHGGMIWHEMILPL